MKAAIIIAVIFAILSLELKDMRKSSMFLLGMFLASSIGCFVKGLFETGTALLILTPSIPLLSLYVIGRSNAKDEVQRFTKFDIIIIMALLFFLMSFFILFPKASPRPVEAEFSPVSIIREVLVILVALSAIWVITRRR